MPLTRVDATSSRTAVEHVLAGLIARGVINTLAALPGIGKSLILLAIAVQMARPEGGEFVGRRVMPGRSVIADFDAPSDGRNTGYLLRRLLDASPDADPDKIHVLEPDIQTTFLDTPTRIQLEEYIAKVQPLLFGLDSFMAAFANVDAIKAKQVLPHLAYLRSLAHRHELALLLIEHLPKPLPGERPGSRGPIGSIAKTAQARTVHVLTRAKLDPADGTYVLRWENQKMSYGPIADPFGIKIDHTRNGIFITEHELPGERPTTKIEAAIEAMEAHLRSHLGEATPRTELFDVAIREAGVSERTAETAIKRLRARLGPELHTIAVVGRGNPIMYSLQSELEIAASAPKAAREGA